MDPGSLSVNYHNIESFSLQSNQFVPFTPQKEEMSCIFLTSALLVMRNLDLIYICNAFGKIIS